MVVLMGTSSINGPFSMAMLNNQRVHHRNTVGIWIPLTVHFLSMKNWPGPAPNRKLFYDQNHRIDHPSLNTIEPYINHISTIITLWTSAEVRQKKGGTFCSFQPLQTRWMQICSDKVGQLEGPRAGEGSGGWNNIVYKYM